MPALAMNETRPIYGRARMYAPHGLGNQLALRRNNIGKLSVLTGGQLRSLDYSFLRDADGLQSDADALLMTPQPKPAPVPPQVEELKQSLGRPVWKQTGSLIDQQIAELDLPSMTLALPLLLYHEAATTHRRALEHRLLALAAEPEARGQLEQSLVGLLEHGLVGYYPGQLKQSDVELILTVLHQMEPSRPLSLQWGAQALRCLTPEQIVDGLAVLVAAGLPPSWLLQQWLLRPESELSEANLSEFASYLEAEERTPAASFHSASANAAAHADANGATYGEAGVDPVSLVAPRYAGAEVRALSTYASFLVECRQQPQVVPGDFADVIDDLKLQGVSDQLLLTILSPDQQVPYLALGFGSPAAFTQNPLDRARPLTVFRYWRELHAATTSPVALNLDLDQVVTNAFKDVDESERFAFEESLVSDAQDLLEAGLRSELLRAFVRDPRLTQRLEREIDAYFVDHSERPLQEARERRLREVDT